MQNNFVDGAIKVWNISSKYLIIISFRDFPQRLGLAKPCLKAGTVLIEFSHDLVLTTTRARLLDTIPRSRANHPVFMRSTRIAEANVQPGHRE